VTKHGNFFDRHQFFDLSTDKFEQRSLYRGLKAQPGPKGGATPGAVSAFVSSLSSSSSSSSVASVLTSGAVGTGGVATSGPGSPLALRMDAM